MDKIKERTERKIRRKKLNTKKTKHRYFRGRKCREMLKVKIQTALIITVVIYLFMFLLIGALIHHSAPLSTRH